jgi:hypothetical protein
MCQFYLFSDTVALEMLLEYCKSFWGKWEMLAIYSENLMEVRVDHLTILSTGLKKNFKLDTKMDTMRVNVCVLRYSDSW